MIIGITGYRGLLGSKFLEHDGAIPIDADITDYDALARAIEKVEPEVIIHCAAMTDVDGCEREPERARLVNVQGTENVLRASQGKPVAFISTDYVFGGHNGPYREDDERHPLNVYGETKMAAEDLMRPQDLICRTTVLYGNRPFSSSYKIDFVFWIAYELSSDAQVEVAYDQWGTPTYADNLATMVRALVRAGYTGIWHTAGAACVSRLQFARIVAMAFGLDPHLIAPTHSEALNQIARRPRHGGLIVSKFQDAFPSILCMTPQEGLVEMESEWGK